MDWIGWTTFGIAVVGATLGVFNAWWMVRRDSVRLRVRLVSLMTLPDGQWTIGIEVTNLGYIPVTLSEVALRRHAYWGKRMVVHSDYFNQVKLPLRMEPRTQITVAAEPNVRGQIKKARCRWCTATTACGVTVRKRFGRL
ncbi:hypothetical protein [Arenimonas fontis]|uniref:Uncharacterized protein n=1 Tax=Arenimonas fontis TaxID=2608255 RepID=A0A5B2ZDY2_9GAMM|nr:hypothetical protein [Arenimonas fontis]KAA2285450.1 hypothetical protein F0415_05935 [Arenimonas fontis]